jgi:hypothetical protein
MMRWRRGFFRLWLLVSVLWLAVCLLEGDYLNLYSEYNQTQKYLVRIEQAIAKANDGINSGGFVATNGEWLGPERLRDDLAALSSARDNALRDNRRAVGALIIQISAAVVPPIILLFLGILIAWVAAGFRPAE